MPVASSSEEESDGGEVRTKRERMGARLWLPAAKLKHPFSAVASSNAYQKPTAEGGSVYKNVESWCGGTRPPISGCLQMIIDCRIRGSW
jgi:hypothetical protein